MIARLAFLLVALAWPACASAEEDKTTPLFATDTPLEISISGPIRTIVRAAQRSTDPHPATLNAAGESHAMMLSARGNSRRRREKCNFPPLRLQLDAKPAETSLLHRQSGLKLVTHCNEGAEAEQYLLREYAAYKLLNALTDESLKVRLVRVTYVDEDRQTGPKWGFLIEDADDAARRLGRKEVDMGNSTLAAVDPEDGARYTLFQYMIGNTDWAMFRGPDPEDCCHNTKMFGEAKDARSNLSPIPYDFDNAGLVDAPYAYIHPAFEIETVKTRVWRGFCAHNGELPGQVAAFRAARPKMEAELRAIPGLEDRTRDTMLRYIDGFFAGISTDERVEARLIKRCR